jgi:hypothetical protein
MTAPWLHDDGTYRCFLCETPLSRTGKATDPDARNQELRESHRILWSRSRGGISWDFQQTSWYLQAARPSPGEPAQWSVGSDQWATMHRNALPELASRFSRVDFTNPKDPAGHVHAKCSIGGYLVFPNGRDHKRPREPRARKWTINQARGCDRRISDRIDLTLEAIRLYFDGIIDRDANPLGDVLDGYGWFFDRFGRGADGFNQYIEFFFLQPLVHDGQVVPLYGDALVFHNALPRRDDPDAYLAYMDRQLAAVEARNALITAWWRDNVEDS